MVRGALADGSAFRALEKACRNFKEVMQAVEYRYQKVYAYEPMEFTKAGEIKSWYRHLKAGRGCMVKAGKHAIHQGRRRKAPTEA